VKRNIPLDAVREILVDEEYIDTEFIGVAPGTDRCGEEHWMIFDYDGLVWRVKYVWGTDYYMTEVGEWEDPFPQVACNIDEIECEQVKKVPVTTYRYEPID